MEIYIQNICCKILSYFSNFKHVWLIWTTAPFSFFLGKHGPYWHPATDLLLCIYSIKLILILTVPNFSSISYNSIRYSCVLYNYLRFVKIKMKNVVHISTQFFSLIKSMFCRKSRIDNIFIILISHGNEDWYLWISSTAKHNFNKK